MANNAVQIGLRKVDSAEYAKANNLRKIEMFNELTKEIFENRVIDLLRVNNTLAPFIVKPVEFGKGWRDITLGLAEIDKFTTNPDARYPKTRNILKDYIQEQAQEIRDLIRLTYNESTMKPYLQNHEKLNELIALTSKRIIDTYAMRNLEFIKLIFGSTDDLYAIKKNDEWYLTAQDWKTKFTNNITYTVGSKDTDVVKMFEKVKETIAQMTLEPSDRFHMKQDIQGMPVSVSEDELILVISNEDIDKWNRYVSMEMRNPEFYKLPTIKTIRLSIPSGTAYVLHNKAIQIAPQLDEQYVKFYETTKDTDIIHHQWQKVGISELHPFVKISKA